MIGVFHAPTAPIARARKLATEACTNPEVYTETASAGREIFRATHGIEGCHFRVEAVPPPPMAPGAGDLTAPPKPPQRAKAWLLGTLQDLLDGDWEMVTGVTERDTEIRAEPPSPFLVELPGPNIFVSLHLRLNPEAKGRYDLSAAGYEQVRAALEDDDG